MYEHAPPGYNVDENDVARLRTQLENNIDTDTDQNNEPLDTTSESGDSDSNASENDDREMEDEGKRN